jgi:hypothetical protein
MLPRRAVRPSPLVPARRDFTPLTNLPSQLYLIARMTAGERSYLNRSSVHAIN